MNHWVVSMIGSREHYAPPRALHRLGLLQRFYTDVWMPLRQSVTTRLPGPLKRLASRFHADLPTDKVVAFNAFGFQDLLRLEYLKRADQNERGEFFCDQGRQFAKRVARHMRPEKPCGLPEVFLGFSSASLETFEALRDTSVVTVLDQFDAAEEHLKILSNEHLNHLDWGSTPLEFPDKMLRRWEEERRLADVVFVNSEWTRKAMAKLGVPIEKIVVGPLAYEAAVEPVLKSAGPRSLPLRVLFVGAVNLGKGIHYLMEAAQGLNAGRFEFVIAGNIEISKQALNRAPSNIRFLGYLPKDRVVSCYRQADVFVFPTLSDGFGIAQIEAMAHGLPVISTKNCGDVVTDGKDGLVIEAGDADALRQALARLEENRDEVEAMSRAAQKKALKFTLENYADTLVRGVQTAVKTKRRQ
jgi:glycosyltransferase involved in cell wall biosynthesis